MLNKIILAAVLLITSQIDLFSQSRIYPPVYFSLNGGGFISARDKFSDIYNSNFGLTFGAGLGIPISSKLYLTGRATYFSKSGTSLIMYHPYSPDILIKTEIRNGQAKFTQLLINTGLEYKITLSENFKLYPMVGFTFTEITEKVITDYINFQRDSDISGILGYYAGTGLERNLETIPLSVFFEAYYNFHVQKFSNEITENAGGANLNLGIRYYLKM